MHSTRESNGVIGIMTRNQRMQLEDLIALSRKLERETKTSELIRLRKLYNGKMQVIKDLYKSLPMEM